MGIVVEEVSRNGTPVSINCFDGDQVSIGRGLDNAVILHDIHVDGHHLKITRDPQTGTLTCYDLNSVNGTWIAETNRKGGINKRGRSVTGIARFFSGQTFQIGKSYVRIYDTHHQVSAALPLSPWEEMAHKLDHWWLWSCLSVILILLQVWDSYLSLPLLDKLSQYFLKACYPILGAFVYAGIFAFLGKNYKHDPKLGSHYSIAIAVILAITIVEFVSPYFSYWVNGGIFKGSASELIWMIFVFIGAYIGLALATPLRHWARIVAASVVPATILISLLIGFLAQPQFKPFAEYDTNLIEPGWQWQEPEQVNQFLNNAEALYDKFDNNEP